MDCVAGYLGLGPLIDGQKRFPTGRKVQHPNRPVCRIGSRRIIGESLELPPGRGGLPGDESVGPPGLQGDGTVDEHLVPGAQLDDHPTRLDRRVVASKNRRTIGRGDHLRRSIHLRRLLRLDPELQRKVAAFQRNDKTADHSRGRFLLFTRPDSSAFFTGALRCFVLGHDHIHRGQSGETAKKRKGSAKIPSPSPTRWRTFPRAIILG